MEDEMMVTVIATGFDGMTNQAEKTQKTRSPGSSRDADLFGNPFCAEHRQHNFREERR